MAKNNAAQPARRETDGRIDALMGKVDKIVETIYTGNGREAMLPRMARIETTLDANTEILRDMDEKLSKLTGNISTLQTSVKDHCEEAHIYKLIKEKWFWPSVLSAYLALHVIVTTLENKGVQWFDLFLKYIGVS